MHAPAILVGLDAAERVLSVLISSTYRKNSLAQMNLAECRSAILAALRRCTKREAPVQLTVLAFPFKVPNPAKVGARRLPDFAEFAAIRHFCLLREAIQRVYPPGLEFHILHDGSLIGEVFGISPQEVRRYEAYFGKLVERAQATDFIRCQDFSGLQRHAALDPADSTGRLRLAAEQWWQGQRGTSEWKLSFWKTFGMMNLREIPATLVVKLMVQARLGRLPAGYERLERRVHSAMQQYHVKDAIIHQFDPRPLCFPDAIHATTQPRRGRLSIWMVRRGQSLLPWHGVGCLDDRGRARVLHAVDVLDRPNWRSVSAADEQTPFVYRQSVRNRGAWTAG
jgi:hypothetical protein